MGGYTAKLVGRERRQNRIRKKVNGSAERPRLSVFRSAAHIYAQVIDDGKGITITAASTLDASPLADAVALCMDRERERRLVRRLIGQIDRASCLCRNRGRLICLAPLSRPFAWLSILQHIPEIL